MTLFSSVTKGVEPSQPCFIIRVVPQASRKGVSKTTLLRSPAETGSLVKTSAKVLPLKVSRGVPIHPGESFLMSLSQFPLAFVRRSPCPRNQFTERIRS